MIDEKPTEILIQVPMHLYNQYEMLAHRFKDLVHHYATSLEKQYQKELESLRYENASLRKRLEDLL